MRGQPASLRQLLVTAVLLGAVLVLADTVPAFSAARRQMWGLHSLAYQEFRDKLPARASGQIGRYVRGAGGGLPVAPPTAAPSPGRYHEPQRVTLSAPGEAQRHIHYTLDGSIPTRLSPRYRDPIVVDATTTLRWRVLNPRALPGEVGTGVFLIEPATRRLPLLALTMDSLDLWGKYSGIYVRPTERGRKFERHAYVSLIESDRHEVGFEAEVRIHGGFSRLSDKKSFRIRFQSSAVAPHVAATDILHPMPGQDEHTLVLRSSSMSVVSRLADVLSTEIYGSLGKPVSRAQSVRVTINGRYWGIYDLRDYISPDFLMARFGAGPFELLAHDSERPETWLTPALGHGRRWHELLSFIRERGLTDAAVFDSAARMLDPEDTIDYWIHNIYIGNLDWPYNNVALWRDIGSEAPYRWLLWDGDAAFSSLGDFTRHNTLAWALRDRPTDSLKWNIPLGGRPDHEDFLVSTEPIRRYLENPQFRDAFVARMLTLLSSAYQSSEVLPRLERLVDEVAPEQSFELRRWDGTDSAYHAALGRMREFIINRPVVVREHLAEHFRLGGERPFVLDVRGPGSLRLGGQMWRDTTVTLTMLAGARLEVEALPDDGAALREAIDRQITVSARKEGDRLRVRFASTATTP